MGLLLKLNISHKKLCPIVQGNEIFTSESVVATMDGSINELNGLWALELINRFWSLWSRGVMRFADHWRDHNGRNQRINFYSTLTTQKWIINKQTLSTWMLVIVPKLPRWHHCLMCTAGHRPVGPDVPVVSQSEYLVPRVATTAMFYKRLAHWISVIQFKKDIEQNIRSWETIKINQNALTDDIWKVHFVYKDNHHIYLCLLPMVF